MEIHRRIKSAIEAMGLTVKQVDKITCYLTPSGMNKLHPCAWANTWMRENGTVRITANIIRKWRHQYPEVWLCPSTYTTLGPIEGWPWKFRFGTCRSQFTNRDLTLLLKAYIVKYGKPQ